MVEYLHAPEPQVRKNAVTALAVLGGRESTRILVEMAMDEVDTDVRRRAEAEILELPDAERALAVDAIQRHLEERPRRNATYALTGRLRSQGWSGRVPLGWSARRLLTAHSLRALLYPKRDLRFRTRSAASAFGGAVVGTLFVLLLMYFAGVDWGDAATALCVSGLFFAGVLAIVVTQRATPIALHYDTLAGAVVELAWTALLSIFPGFLLVIVAMLLSAPPDDLLPAVPTAVLVDTPLLALAVRAATLATGGVSASPRVNQWIATAAGTSAGWLVASMLHVARQHGPHNAAVVSWWLLALPASIALAAAFAAIDADAPRPRRVLGPLSPLLAAVLVSAVLVPVFALLAPRRTTGTVHTPDAVQVSIPASVAIRVPSDMILGAAVLSDSGSDLPLYYLSISHGFGPPVASAWHLRPTVVAALEAGEEYQISLAEYGGDVAEEVFARLSERLGRRTASGERRPPRSVYLEITPLPDSTTAAREAYLRSGIVSSTSLVDRAVEHAIAGRIPIAIREFQLAARADSTAVMAKDWNSLCWYASIGSWYSDREVSRACERAVRGAGAEDSPFRANFRDSRGVNRLRNGDAAGAIADFTAYAQAYPSTLSGERRMRWVEALRRGRNPLTHGELEALRKNVDSNYSDTTMVAVDTIIR